jgi:hypothetical protein
MRQKSVWHSDRQLSCTISEHLYSSTIWGAPRSSGVMELVSADKAGIFYRVPLPQRGRALPSGFRVGTARYHLLKRSVKSLIYRMMSTINTLIYHSKANIFCNHQQILTKSQTRLALGLFAVGWLITNNDIIPLSCNATHNGGVSAYYSEYQSMGTGPGNRNRFPTTTHTHVQGHVRCLVPSQSAPTAYRG